MFSKLTYQLDSQIAIIGLNNPPVNSLGHQLRQELQQALRQALLDSSVKAVVVTSTQKLFSGGADISEFGTDATWASPSLPDLLYELEEASKPVIAAISGSALGGGLELALACDYRMATADARLGLPEVSLGLLPGAGGTQRLPRLTSVPFALEMIFHGQPVLGAVAYKEGLVDRISNGDFAADARVYAQELLEAGALVRSCSELSVKSDDLPEDFFSEFRRANARKLNGFFAPEQCIRAIESACELPLRQGLAIEHELFLACLGSPEARAQQHLFFAEREATRVPGIRKEVKPRPIQAVAVIGAGTMGGGIAMNFLNAGLPVTLLDTGAEALERGLATIEKNYQISAKKGRMTADQVAQRMSLLRTTLDYQDLAEADLVIEAVFESMAVKKDVFGRLDEVCKPGAILASNTSTLDVDNIAAFTRRPGDVIGLHFFSPANVMRLLEIVRGRETEDDVVLSALAMARMIRKVPVVVGVCFGFVGNRMLEPYAREAHRLLLEGATPGQVDRVMTDFGLAMGPLSMYDLAGIDVGYLVRESRREAIAHDPGYCLVADKLYEQGRLGQKSGRGFYVYEGRNQHEDADVVALAESLAGQLGIARREVSDQEIFERCLYSLINEGAEILREGIAYRSGDCDLIWVNGYGFPVWRGGPMHYAGEVGLDRILQGMEKYREQLGEYGAMWFQPSPLLVELARQGRAFSEYQRD